MNMNKNRKTLLGLILVTLVVAVGYFVWRNSQEKTPSDKEKIKIGVILPLTGGGAIYGEDIKKGIDLAFAESPIKDKLIVRRRRCITQRWSQCLE